MPRKAEPVRAARPEKIAAFRVGISAKSRAAAHLVAKGYRILARRWKSPHGEIDIVLVAPGQIAAAHSGNVRKRAILKKRLET